MVTISFHSHPDLKSYKCANASPALIPTRQAGYIAVYCGHGSPLPPNARNSYQLMQFIQRKGERQVAMGNLAQYHYFLPLPILHSCTCTSLPNQQSSWTGQEIHTPAYTCYAVISVLQQWQGSSTQVSERFATKSKES